MKTRPVRPPLEDDADDAALSARVGALARATGVPSLTPPADAPRPGSRKSIKLEVPDYLFSALSLAAVQQGVTKKYLILKALQDAGYPVEAADLIEDGRRNR